MSRFSALLLIVLVPLLVAAPAAAQSRQIPGPPQARPVVIHNATVHPVSGPAIERGWVRFVDGRLTHVAAGEPSPRLLTGAEVIDASGLHIYPGLVASFTQLGLTETAVVGVTVDYNEYGDIKPEVRAAVAVNPDSDLIPVTRANGILLAGIMPRGGTISGRASTIRLDGWTWEDMTIDDTAGLVVNWPRTEPIDAWWMNRSASAQRKEIKENLEELDALFDEAEAYLASKAEDSTLATEQRFEAMRAAIEGREPLIVYANGSGQIESAVSWCVRRGYEVIIAGGAEAAEVLPLLRRHDIPVIINGLHRLPTRRHASAHQIYELPAALHEAGVRFCLASGAEPAHERELPYNAARAVAHGLPKAEALRALTQHAADILGFGADYGTLEVDKSATLIVTTGDPLEVVTDTLMAYIDGRRIDLGNRQKTLYDKYRTKYIQLGVLEPEPDPTVDSE